MACQTVEQTLAEVISWRPVLEPVLRAFEPILAAQNELVAELAPRMLAAGQFLPEPQSGHVAQGVSLVAGSSVPGVAGMLRISAEKLLPLMGNLEAMAPHMAALKAYFLRPVEPIVPVGPSTTKTQPDQADSPEALFHAVVSGNHGALESIAHSNGMEPLVLEFVASFIVSSVIRAMVAGLLSGKEQAFWDEGDAWRQGYCPVCGALPSLGWLDKPALDDKNAYLAGGGGKKHLHCGLCGANWKFHRGACPSCGQEGNGVVEILRENGLSHGERLDCCTKCHTYCPTVDLREREFVPNLDAAAFGMMHLDMVATRKKLRPLRPSFWNVF